MKKALLYVGSLLSCLAVFWLLLMIPVWVEDSIRREGRELISANVIKAGSQLEVEQWLGENGFTYRVSSHDGNLIVEIGNDAPNMFESFGYAAEVSWMPLSHSESSWLEIRISSEGDVIVEE